MKFAVINEGDETPIALSLHINRSGTIATVMGEMSDGMSFNILSLHEDGTFVRHNGLPADAGFKLTDTDESGIGRQIVETGVTELQDDLATRMSRIRIPVGPAATASHFHADEAPEDYDEDE